jgi:hypothetical protein
MFVMNEHVKLSFQIAIQISANYSAKVFMNHTYIKIRSFAWLYWQPVCNFSYNALSCGY